MSKGLSPICRLSKAEIVMALEEVNEDTEGNFEQVRARLRQYVLRSDEEMMRTKRKLKIQIF